MAPPRRSRFTATRARQRGATAMEFGLIFPALFLLIYGTLSFALMFTARMGLQHAAEEGARSAVIFRVAGDTDPADIAQLTLRQNAARDAALQQAGWISRWAPVSVETRVCLATSDCSIATTECGRDPASACKIMVTVTYPYGSNPILPTVPGLGVIAPNELRGQASLMLEGRMLSS
jgi:Flp pilus assembly protein TadG